MCVPLVGWCKVGGRLVEGWWKVGGRLVERWWKVGGRGCGGLVDGGPSTSRFLNKTQGNTN